MVWCYHFPPSTGEVQGYSKRFLEPDGWVFVKIHLKRKRFGKFGRQIYEIYRNFSICPFSQFFRPDWHKDSNEWQGRMEYDLVTANGHSGRIGGTLDIFPFSSLNPSESTSLILIDDIFVCFNQLHCVPRWWLEEKCLK